MDSKQERKSKIHFQIEKPESKDLFDGNGHSHAAEDIKQVIENQGEVHLLGLEGKLGAGKSTVLKILESKLDSNKYKFITFDVDKYHHSSTKASLIKVLSSKLDKIIGENEKSNIEHAKDKALGNILDYTKKTTSQLNPYTVAFAISVILSVKLINEALIIIIESLLLLINGEGSINLENILTILFAFSPLLVWITMKYHEQLKHKKNQDYKPLTLGDLFKKNTDDTITEKLNVTREVGSIELREAFESFIKVIPKDICIILIIDNIDRVDAEKVKEVWSDLDIFTSISTDSLRIILPYSETHVAKALKSDDDEYSGEEYIAKKLPVVFRTPPIVSAGWQLQFEQYWKETLPNTFGHSQTSELIDIWVAQRRQVTPRFLKKHINDIASILISNPNKEISPIVCSAYILVVKENKISMHDFLSIQSDGSQKNVSLIATYRILGDNLDMIQWTSQVACINYQTVESIARSELLETPIKSALATYDIDTLLKLSSVYGFFISFKKEIERTNNLGLIKISSRAVNRNTSEAKKWTNDWLPIFNKNLQSKDKIEEFDIDFIESIKNLKSHGYDIELDIVRHTMQELVTELEAIVDGYSPEKDGRLILSHIYAYSELLQEIPSTISQPREELLVSYLWPERENFIYWEIENQRLNKNNIEKIIQISNEQEEPYDNELFEWLTKFMRIGSIDFSIEDNSIDINPIRLDTEDCILMLYSKYWKSKKTTQTLSQLLNNCSEKDGGTHEKLIALLFSLSINTDILNNKIEVFNSNNVLVTVNTWGYLKPYLDKYPAYTKYFTNFLTFAKSFSNILDYFSTEEIATYLKEPVRDLILENRIQRLGINAVITHHYYIFDNIFDTNEKPIMLNWLWKKERLIRKTMEEWSPMFISDILRISDNNWIKRIINEFDNQEKNEDDWERELINPNENIISLVKWMKDNSKKIKNSRAPGIVLEKIHTLISDTDTYIHYGWLKNIFLILPKKTQDKATRKLLTTFTEQTTNLNERLFILKAFSSWIELPTARSDEVKTMYMSIIDGTSDTEIMSWLDTQNWHLDDWNEKDLATLHSCIDAQREVFSYDNLSSELNQYLKLEDEEVGLAEESDS